MSSRGVAERRRHEVLCEQRDQLLASIEDLDREHGAGELEDDDYSSLRAGYVERVASLLRQIDEASSGGAAGSSSGSSGGPAGAAGGSARTAGPSSRLRRRLGSRRTRRLLGGLFAICCVALIALFALRLAGVRLPGETASGSITLDKAQQVQQDLQRAQVLADGGDTTGALSLYQQVLALEANNAQALTYRGWLLRLTGVEASNKRLVQAGRDSMVEALRFEPHYGDAHLLLGLSLVEDSPRDLGGGVAQFRLALDDGAASQLVTANKAIMASAFRTDRQAVPPVLAGSKP